MGNTYKLKNGEQVEVQAWDIDDFIMSDYGRTSKLIREGVSKWKLQDGTYINVNNEDTVDFLDGKGNGAVLFHGNQTMEDLDYTMQTGIEKKNESFWEDPLGWWQIDSNETQETNTWIEDWFSPGEGTSNQLTDLLGDTYKAAKQGWTSASNLTELSQLYGGASMTEEEQKEAWEAMENMAKMEISDEMREFQRDVNRSGRKGWDWIDSLSEATFIENPSLATEVLVSSMTGLVRGVFEKEGFAWGMAGAGIGAASGAAIGAGVGSLGAGVGAGPGAIAGAIRGAWGGLVGGVSGALEAGSKMGELLREEVASRGLEWTFENAQTVMEDYDAMKKLRNKAITKGVVIGAFEALAAGITGAPLIRMGGTIVKAGLKGVSKQAIKRSLGKPLVRSFMKNAVMEGGMGALGEAVSSLAIGEAVDSKAVTLEAVSGGPGSVLSLVQGIRNPVSYKINGKEATYEQVYEFLSDPDISDLDAVKAVEIKGDGGVLSDEMNLRKKALKISMTIDPKISKEDREILIQLESELQDLEALGGETNKQRVKILKEQIAGVVSKYDSAEDYKAGQTKTAVDTRRSLLSEQEGVVEKAQKEGGIEQDEVGFDFADEYADVLVEDYKQKNPDATEADIAAFRKRALKSDGYKTKDGKIYINREVAAQTKAWKSVGEHEVLHNMVDGSFYKLDAAAKKSYISNFKSKLKALDPEAYARVQKRINKFQQDPDTSVEWFNYYRDDVKQNGIGKAGIKGALVGFWNNFMNKETPYKVLEMDAEEMVEFIQNQNFENVEYTVGEGTKGQFSESVDDLGNMGWDNKSWKESGARFVMDEIVRGKMLDGLIGSKLKDTSVNLQDFIKDVYANLYSHVRSFNPEENDSLFGWINSQIGNRSAQVYNKIQKGKTPAGTKSIGEKNPGEREFDIADEEKEFDFETEDMSVGAKKKDTTPQQKTSRLRRRLGIQKNGEIYNKVVEAVKKTFGTKLPKLLTTIKDKAVDRRAFKQALGAAFAVELMTIIKTKILGEKSKVYGKFLESAYEYVFDFVPKEKWVQLESGLPREERVFTEVEIENMSPAETDRAIEEGRVPKTTSRDSGNTLWRFKKPTPKQFKSFFLAPTTIPSKKDPSKLVRSGTRGNRKTALAEILSAELGFDATMTAYKDPSVRSKFGLIQEVMGFEKIENDVAEIAKAIEREQTGEFSFSFLKEKDKTKRAALISIFLNRITDYKDEFGNDKKGFLTVLEENGGLVREAYEEVYGTSMYSNRAKKSRDKLINELETYLRAFPGVEKTIGKKITKEEMLKSMADPDEMATFDLIFGVKRFKATKQNALRVRAAWFRVGLRIGPALVKRFLIGNVLGAAGKIFGTDLLGSGVLGLDLGKAQRDLGIAKNFLQIFENKLKVATTAKQKEAARNGIKRNKAIVAGLEEKIASGNLKTKFRYGVFHSRLDAAGLIPVIERTFGKQEDITTVDNEPTSSPYQKILNDPDGGLTALFGEAEKYGKIAKDNGAFLMIFAETIGVLVNEGKINPQVASFMFKQLLNIGMRSPISLAARLTNVPTDKKFWTQKLVYEHSTPRREIAINLAAYSMGIISKEEMQTMLDNYEVSLITEEMNDKLKAENLVQQRKPMASFDTPSIDRYDHSWWNLALTNIHTKKPEPVTTKRAESNFSETINEDNILSKAIAVSRSVNPRKGISVWDFDDTLAKSKSNVLFTDPDGLKGKLNAEEFASKGAELLDLGYVFDFSEFNKVVKGEKGPFFQKFVNRIKKFGVKDNFILTARPKESAPSIKAFLKSVGLDIPLKNITGLANSTAAAKALWVAEKVGEGYNDFYFADDALQNVQAVDNMLSQFDVKRKVQQAKGQFSESMSSEFNSILEKVVGVLAGKKVGKQAARMMGGKFDWSRIGLFAASAQDFKGLLYSFLPKGKEGEKAMKFFKEALIDPFSRGIDELNRSRQAMSRDYKALLKKYIGIKKKLRQKVGNTQFTVDHAVRVWIWNSLGFETPGLTTQELIQLIQYVDKNPELKAFAQALKVITKRKDGYSAPSNNWVMENISSDLFSDGSLGDARSVFLAEFIQNVDNIFSEENLNKIESIYGSKFREALEDIIYRMKTGSNRPTGRNRLVNQFMNWTNNSVGAIMFFNMRSAILQTISMFNYINWSDNNPMNAAMAFGNQKQFWADFVMIFNSDFLMQRRSGNRRTVNEAELAAAVRGSNNKAKAAIAWLLEKGFLPTQIADSFAIASGGAIFYRNRVKSLMKEGMSREQAESQAFLDFQEKTEESQQSSRPDLISQQQASPLGRLILAFANTPMQYMRIINKAARDLVNGRGDAKTHVSKIVYYGVVQAALFTALQQAMFAMFGEEEDEEDEDRFIRMADSMLENSLVGFGITGRAVGTLKRALVEYYEQKDKGFQADHAYTLLALTNFSPPIGSKLRKVYSAIQTEKFNSEIMMKRGFTLDNPLWNASGNVIEAFTNIPLGRLANKMFNVDNAMDSNHEWWQRTALFLGWNMWDLKLKDPDIDALKINSKSKGRGEESKFLKPKYKNKNTNKKSSGGNAGESRCKGTNSKGKQCGINTTSSSGYCHYHD